MVTDPIADMFVRIRNAGKSGKTLVSVPFSELKLRIANVLLKEGYVDAVEKKTKGSARIIEIVVSYEPTSYVGEVRIPRMKGASRVSRPSRRMYIGAKDIRPVNDGHGIMIISTPKGVMTGNEARKENVGGEVIGKVW